MLTLALSTLRARKGGFVGAFVALCCAAALVTACGVILETGLRGGIPVERYRGADLVVLADQELHWTKEKKGRTKVKSKPLTERAWLDASAAATVRGVPGVREVIGEVTFPAVGFAADGRTRLTGTDGRESWGYGWASAALTPLEVRAGSAPAGAGEVVVDAATARRAGLEVGDTLSVQATGAPTAYTVSGVAGPPAGSGVPEPHRQSSLFFADEEAERLAGRPGRLAALGVRTEPGADPAAVRQRVADALAAAPETAGARVHAGDDRGAAEFLGAGQARVTLVSLGGALGGTSLLVAILVVTGTFALSVQQRRREVALLRAVGATPRQIRRMIGGEALVVGAGAGAVGAVAGLPLGHWLGGRFTEVGAMPRTLELAVSPFPVIAAFVATLLAALAAARVSARRPARIRPTEALAEAATERPRAGRGRVIAGVLVLGGYAVLLAVLGTLETEPAATPVTFLSVVVAAVAVALLGPLVARAATGLLGVPMRLLSPVGGALAAANSRTAPRRLAAVVTPLSLAVAMSATILFAQTTLGAAANEEAAAGTRAEHTLVAGGPGVPAGAAEAVRAVPGVVGAGEVLHATVRIGQDKYPARGVTAAVAERVVDPGVVQGSLGDLAEGTVALSRLAARQRDAGVGDTVEVTMGDGAVRPARVVAVYERRLGFGDVTLPREVLAAHVDNPLAAGVLIAGTADRAELAAAVAAFPQVRVVDRDGADALRRQAQRESGQVEQVAMGLVITFTGIAVVNTLVMATAARRREFALLRLAGATRRQIRRMLRWETACVVGIAVALGGAVAWATLTAYSLGMTGTGTVHAPLAGCLAIAAAGAGLAYAATAVPARLVLRRNPAEALGGRE